MAAHSALFGIFADAHPDDIVEISDARVSSSEEIFGVEIEHRCQKIVVLLRGHIHFALARVAERPQTRDELQMREALAAEKAV